jgi:hypothetical protein
MGHPTDLPGGVVLVRRPGTWHLTPVGDVDEVLLDRTAVLALVARARGEQVALGPEVEAVLDAAREHEPDVASVSVERLRALADGADGPVNEPAGDEQVRVVRPAEAVALALVPGGLLVHGGGSWTVLGEEDVVLVDLVDRRRKAAPLVEEAAAALASADVEGLRARLAVLVAHHVVAGRRPRDADERRAFVDERPPPNARLRPVASSDRPVVRAGAPGRVPVWAPWDHHDLPLGLAMVTARARHDDVVHARFDVRPPQRAEDVVREMAAHQGPAVLLCSNYLWTLDANLSLARAAKAANPELLVVHGGPATPKYDADVDAFFADGGDVVDVAIRGEGEETLAEALAAVGRSDEAWDLAPLAAVAGLAFRGAQGLVRTDDRERIAELDALPSPYLAGDFDHLQGTAATVETNRGCPYGCTFCDWGSATLSRVRKFDLDRVEEEMRWLATRGIEDWTIGDANFGIFPRDVEVAERLVAIKRETGLPERVAFCLAKNTTRHLVQIVDLLNDAGVACHCSLSLQSRDPDTLAAVDRRNIKTEHYAELANAFRRKQLPLLADLMLGLPGQTLEGYRGDLQFLFDLEVACRTWPTQVLPNAPLNAPEYRAEHGLVVDERRLLVSTSTYTREDRDEMRRLRMANGAFEHFGLLRHVLRFLQWDHGLPATEVAARMVALAEDEPHRYPLLSWVLHWLDVHTVPPVGWPAFFAEVRDVVEHELGVPPSSALDAVLAAQQHLMPDRGRRLPDEVVLEHDVVSWYRDATRWMWDDEPVAPHRLLASYGPATLEVWGDPHHVCGPRLGVPLGNRSEVDIGSFWMGDHWELDSPLTRNLSEVAGDVRYRAVRELRAGTLASVALPARRPEANADGDGHADGVPVAAPVRLGG